VKLHLTPRGYLVRAVLISVAFGVVHFLGWRDETRFLSGTPASPILGVTYAIVYFLFVLAAPTLVIAAAILSVLGAVVASRPEGRT
jgi:hypothetical protein